MRMHSYELFRMQPIWIALLYACWGVRFALRTPPEGYPATTEGDSGIEDEHTYLNFSTFPAFRQPEHTLMVVRLPLMVTRTL